MSSTPLPCRVSNVTDHSLAPNTDSMTIEDAQALLQRSAEAAVLDIIIPNDGIFTEEKHAASLNVDELRQLGTLNHSFIWHRGASEVLTSGSGVSQDDSSVGETTSGTEDHVPGLFGPFCHAMLLADQIQEGCHINGYGPDTEDRFASLYHLSCEAHRHLDPEEDTLQINWYVKSQHFVDTAPVEDGSESATKGDPLAASKPSCRPKKEQTIHPGSSGVAEGESTLERAPGVDMKATLPSGMVCTTMKKEEEAGGKKIVARHFTYRELRGEVEN